MKVHIACHDYTWILQKFADKLNENLQKLGIKSDISGDTDSNADINHHLIYRQYDGKISTIDTLMITHIDTLDKFNQLQKQMLAARVGICMSRETMNNMAKMGIDKSKLCYVNPAHDGVIPIKKIVIGTAAVANTDGRKNEHYFNKLAKVLNPKYFKFKIMGARWDEQIKCFQKFGFETEYTEQFDYDKYVQFIPSLDYYIHMGSDEGHMGILDALTAGIKTIIVPQGYHLDAINGITHPFTTYDELENLLLNIQKEKETLVSSVATWTWLDYTKKHIEIWQYLLDNKKINSAYTDGLNSLWEQTEYDPDFKQKELIKIKKTEKRQKHTYIRRKIIRPLKKGNFSESFNFIHKKFNNLVKKILKKSH